MIRKSPLSPSDPNIAPGENWIRESPAKGDGQHLTIEEHGGHEPTEHTPLIEEHSEGGHFKSCQQTGDPESLGDRTKPSRNFVATRAQGLVARGRSCCYLLAHPKTWNFQVVLRETVLHPVKLLPAVFLGLLLNILDALSYGMILFPLGEPLFQDLGSDGIAIFYVSTIISQVIYSSGGSVFRGGIGSEMIEVVPFFHKMAYTILQKVGNDNPKTVLATTILSFALSSILTGIVFFLMGACRLGSLIGFFPVSLSLPTTFITSLSSTAPYFDRLYWRRGMVLTCNRLRSLCKASR